MKSASQLFKFPRLSMTAAIITSATLMSCGTSSSLSSGSVGDSSASGAAAGAVGGALSGSSASGTQASLKNQKASTLAKLKNALNPLPLAMAKNTCPTFATTGASCSASGSSMWLTYDDCTFAGRADWNGVQELSMSSGTATCGTFPKPAANDTLYRQYVQSSGVSQAGSIQLTGRDGSVATVDDATSNLGNFDGDTISTINPDGGYGAAVTFNSSDARSGLTIGHHISVSGVYDHSVSGSLTVTETAGASSRTVTGSVKVYHNLLKVVGTSTFTDVIHDDTCCLPVGGTITTTFSAGTNVSPTNAGSKMVGKSETLTFTGCGTATLQAYDGSLSNVEINHCF